MRSCKNDNSHPVRQRKHGVFLNYELGCAVFASAWFIQNSQFTIQKIVPFAGGGGTNEK